MLSDLLIGAAGVIAGSIAAVTGFGIGSLLTPALAHETGMKLAVAAVSIPHFIGTAQRCWTLRRHVDTTVLLRFGIASAVAGLAGALIHAQISSRSLSFVFGILLALAAIAEFTGWMERVRWGRRAAWIAGAISGALGGVVGNQGGIRTAAMLGFRVPKEQFVATASAIGLIVDVARMPVYLTTQWDEIIGIWPVVAVATVGVVIGTAFGTRLLGSLPQRMFRPVIATVLLMIGIYMLAGGGK
jgi:uncharacterized protein